MRVITIGRLREFWESGHADSEQPLRAWHKEAEKAGWACWADVRASYASADAPGNGRVVFNIGGNKYRLIVKVDYEWKKVFIRRVCTHADYSAIKDVTVI
jgi:mRNA interferase HigB